MFIIFKYLFFFLSLFCVVLSNSWISIWFFLEMNLFSLILLFWEKSGMNSETLIKYFLIQTLCSLWFLGSILFYFSNVFLSLIFLIKLAVPPFHLWFFSIFQFMKKQMMKLLLTWTKLPYFFLLFLFLKTLINFFFFLILMSCLIGFFLSLMSGKLMLLLLGSSFIQSAWLMISFFYSFQMFFIFSSFYFFFMNILIKKIWTKKFCFFISFNLSLMFFLFLLIGSPPFSMFFLKWFLLFFLLKKMIFLFFLLILTGISILFYFRFFLISIFSSFFPIYFSFLKIKLNIFLLFPFLVFWYF